jgi:hypothetical protein
MLRITNTFRAGVRVREPPAEKRRRNRLVHRMSSPSHGRPATNLVLSFCLNEYGDFFLEIFINDLFGSVMGKEIDGRLEGEKACMKPVPGFTLQL